MMIWQDRNMSECFMWNYMYICWLINWSDSAKNARCYNKIYLSVHLLQFMLLCYMSLPRQFCLYQETVNVIKGCITSKNMKGFYFSPQGNVLLRSLDNTVCWVGWSPSDEHPSCCWCKSHITSDSSWWWCGLSRTQNHQIKERNCQQFGVSS